MLACPIVISAVCKQCDLRTILTFTKKTQNFMVLNRNCSGVALVLSVFWTVVQTIVSGGQ